MSQKASCHCQMILISNHQFWTTSVYWNPDFESFIWMVFFWTSSSLVLWTVDCLGFFPFKFVSPLISLPSNLLEMFWHENAVLYYLAFPNDRLYLKCLVYGLYTFEFVQCVLIVEAAFHTFVTSFGDVDVFNRVNTEWLSVPIFTALGKLYRTWHA